MPINNEARRRNKNLPGQGGVFQPVNLAVYQYGGNSPNKYADPAGGIILPTFALDLMTNYDESVKLGNSTTSLFRLYGCYVAGFGNAMGSREAYSYRGGFGAGLDFKRTMSINKDPSMFLQDSGYMTDRAMVMDKLFGAGNWDYWTQARQGVQGIKALLEQYAGSEDRYLVVGIFDISSVVEGAITHMGGINAPAGEEGTFGAEAITPTSRFDKARLADEKQRQAYSLENLKEIRVIRLEEE